MTAVRIEVPPGVAPPVWVAHIVRNALTRALADRLDPRSLRVEVEDENAAGGKLLGPGSAEATRPTGTGHAGPKALNGGCVL